MSMEVTKYKITNHLEIRKYLSTFIIVLSGGLVGLLLGPFTYSKVILFIFGALLNITFVNSLIKHNIIIEELINDLDKG